MRAQLERWSRRQDLPGADGYVVSRRYKDYRAFIELTWTIRKKGHHAIYRDEKRVPRSQALSLIDTIEDGELLEALKHTIE